MVLLSIFLPLFFIVFSFTELGRIQFQNGIALNLIDVFVSILLLVWVFLIKKSNYQLKRPIAIFIIVCVFSILVNLGNFKTNQLLIGSLYLVRWVAYAFLYFVFADLGKSYKNKIPKYMFLSGVITLAVGFVQYFFYPSLRNLYYQGWDEHLFRLFSSFLDPNFAGTFFVLFFVFLFVYKDKLFKSNKRAVYISYPVLFLTFVAIILTYSRGALVMLSVCTLAYCAIQKNYKLLIGFVGVLLVVFVVLSPRFYIENTNLLRKASLGQRIESSKQALNIYSKNPIFGVGFNSLRYAREKYGYTDQSKIGPSHSGAGADNSFVLILTTTGIPGIIAYMFLLYKIFKLGLSRIKANPFALILVVSLIGLIVNSLLINSLLYSFVMIWMWILAGLTENS